MEHFLKVSDSYLSLVEVSSVEQRSFASDGKHRRTGLSMVCAFISACFALTCIMMQMESALYPSIVFLLASWLAPQSPGRRGNYVIVTLTSSEQWAIECASERESDDVAMMVRAKVKEARRSNPVNVFQDNRSVTMVGNGRYIQ